MKEHESPAASSMEFFDREELPAKVAELGCISRRFHVPRGRVLRSLFIGPTALLGGVILLVISQIGLMMGQGGWGNKPMLLFLVLVGFLLIGSGAGTVQLALQHCGERFVVLTRGFARLRKSSVELFPWGDIRQFQWTEAATHDGVPKKMSATLAIGHSILRSANIVKLRRNDGKMLRLDDFIEDVVELTSIIHSETAKVMMPGLLTRFETGETLTFGSLRVSRKGIARRSRTVQWGDVRELKFERHTLFVYERGKSMYAIGVAYQQIPNLHVFLALVRHALNLSPDDDAFKVMGDP